MTPIGNPQNVYLFQTYQMTLGSFYAAILPYGIVAFLFLLALIFFNFKKEKIAITVDEENSFSKSLKYKRFWSLVFILLFILCLLNILRIVPHYVTFILVLASLFLFDKKTFRTINFNLLIKFVCLFILVGDIAQIPWINSFLSHIISGREIGGGILVSQIVSNVPAAILLSKFTQNSTALLIGVNIGGLGTLIASMASMISLEYYKKNSAANSKNYIACFTKYNLIFLVLELVTAQLAGC
jgi:Na+/H+ antiporter NhaD/arsenite permease-like protein